MTKYRNPAIVLGGGLTGLGLVRNLGRKGVDVYCVVDEIDIALYSKYCKKYFIVSHIEYNKEVLRSFLGKIRRELHDYAVLFPSSDMFSLNLSYLKDEIVDNFYAPFSGKEIVETLVNKKKFYQSLDKQKILHPITYYPESLNDVAKISKEIDYPVYVRPAISQIFQKRFHKKGFVARSKEEIVRCCRLASKYKIDIMIQEIVSGSALFLFGINGYFDKNGNPCGLFAYQRLREWPHRFGNSTLMESISISDVSSIKEIICRYLHDLRYHGIMDAEFKKDPRDGNFKFLEINARSWWQNSFPTKCGINLVFMAYLNAIGKQTDYTENYEVGVKWMFFLHDLRSTIKMFKGRQITVGEWLSSLYGIKDWAYFSADDPLPWALSPLFILSSLRKVS